jgi:4-amino-4-deoxy-L-arabinose transferase-like glycosyltransferase
MSVISANSPGLRGGYRDMVAAWAERWALPLILVVAGLNFFWQLGSSSYFTDEAYSVIHSLPSFHTMFHLIARSETTPWTYFLFLHEWMIRTGSQAEWVTRLPSAVAGVALVWATYWMAGAFVARRFALGAAALAALSPLITSYAQEARVYVFLMLAVTISAGAAVRAVHRAEHSGRLLAVGALAAFLAIWFHYTALSVVIPLAVWVGTRSSLTVRQRVAFVGVCLLGIATVMPLLLEQYHYTPNGGAINGPINWNNVIAVVGTPFGTRVGTPVDVRTVVAALAVLAAAFVVLFSPRKRVSDPRLLVALGAFGVLALIGLDITGKHILITRYTTIIAPFLVTSIAAACAQLPRPAAGVLAAAAAAVAIAGVVDDHSTSGFYPPAKDAIDYIAAREHPGDFMITPGIPLTDVPLFYYDTRRMRPKLHFFGLTYGYMPAAFSVYRRIWIIDQPAAATDAAAVAEVQPLLQWFNFRPTSVRVFSTSIPLGVVLAQPAA